mgnify:CR=1 FL=1
MATINIKDKTFETLIPEEEILRRRWWCLPDRATTAATRLPWRGRELVADVDEPIKSIDLMEHLKGKKPLLLGVLNGSFIFAADLMRMLTIESEVSFVKMASYEGTSSTGSVKKLLGLNEDIKGRTVVIVEDIVDSGLTMERMLEYLKEFNPAEIHICTLLLKPDNLKRKLDIEYVAMEIPNDFIVGYGLDYDGLGRNLRDIYVVK